MLKIKRALNYRRGNRSARCLFCEHYVAEFDCIGLDGSSLGKQPRCKEIGLKPGRMYQVNSDSRCDRFVDRFA